jgi:hypothetical protein
LERLNQKKEFWMKKHLSLFGLTCATVIASMMPPVSAATNRGASGASVADLSSGPDKKSNTKVTEYKKYETRTSTATYSVKPKATATTANLYYVAPASRRASAMAADGQAPAVTSARSQAVKKVQERKYYLAHPFFQPQQGKFSSLTDLAYTTNSYGFELSDPNAGSGSWGDYGLSGKWKSKQLSIKEDVGYGITDRVSAVGSARYSNAKYEFNWNPPVNVADRLDQQKNSGFDVLGLGMQWRFYDDAEWIAYMGAYYQWWKDLANVIAADTKVGYKINSNATFYGLARLHYTSWDENSYGNGISNSGTGRNLYLSYKENTKNSFYYEGGVGFFTVLSEDFTLNLETVFGNYDWHNQGSFLAAFGWQPSQQFALNLYAKLNLYDSADDAKSLKMYAWNTGGPVYYQGEASLGKYKESTFGLQAMFTF